MFWKEGPEFLNAEATEVIAHLRERKLVVTLIPPDRLHVAHDSKTLWLQYLNGRVRQYPLCRSFVQKLLSWF